MNDTNKIHINDNISKILLEIRSLTNKTDNLIRQVDELTKEIDYLENAMKHVCEYSCE